MKLPKEISGIKDVELPPYAKIVYHARMKKLYLHYDISPFIDTEGIEILKNDFLEYFYWRYRQDIQGSINMFVVKTYRLKALKEYLPVDHIKEKILELARRQDKKTKELFKECKDEFLEKERYVSAVLSGINSIFDCETEIKIYTKKEGKDIEFIIKNVNTDVNR